MTESVKISSTASLAAAIPSLVGFVPNDGSIVLITITNGRKVGLTLRADFPAAVGDDPYAEFAKQLAEAVVNGEPDLMGIEVVGWGTDIGQVDAVYAGLASYSLPLGACLTVQNHDGEWRVLDSDDPDPVWEPLGPDLVRPLAALAGVVVESSRADLGLRIQPDGNVVLTQVERDLSWQVADPDGRDDVLSGLVDEDNDELLAIREVFMKIARAQIPGSARRDGSLAVVAITSWLVGDGAMAWVALEECSETYALAHLLIAALSIPLRPGDMRQLLIELGRND